MTNFRLEDYKDMNEWPFGAEWLNEKHKVFFWSFIFKLKKNIAVFLDVVFLLIM